MKLHELSEGYLHTARLLKAHLKMLRAACAKETDPQKRAALRTRMSALGEILTQCNDLAELTAHYYERGFTRNGKYTL